MKCTAKCYMSPHMSMGKHKTSCALDGQIIKERFCVACAGGSVPDCGICDDKGYFVPEEAKPFDITKHEFFDGSILDAHIVDSIQPAVTLRILRGPPIDLLLADAIALAKHFKITAEDLS